MTTQPDTLPELPRFTALKALPPGYDLAGRLTLDSLRTLILLNLLSLVPLLISAACFLGVDQLLNALGVRPMLSTPPSDDERLGLSLVAVVFMLVVLGLHELCHGLAFQVFGARPHYGVNLSKGVAYASAKDYYLTRSAYLIVALAPLVIISVATVIGMALTGGDLRFVVGLMGAINAGSSVGDLWFAAVCLSHPRTLLVRDFGEGAELFTRRSGS